jgi:hypothetical protein
VVHDGYGVNRGRHGQEGDGEGESHGVETGRRNVLSVSKERMVLMTLKGYLDLTFWVRRGGKGRTGDGA